MKTVPFVSLAAACLLIVSSYSLAQAPANDNCSGATVISVLPYHTTENTRTATRDSVNDPQILCNNGGAGLDGKTVWFKYTAGSSQWLRFSTVGSGPNTADSVYDTVLGLFTGTCGHLTEVACNDDSLSGTVRQSVMYYLVQKDTVYYILVAEWNNGGISGGTPTGGDLVLDVAPGVPPPAPPLFKGPRTGSVASGATVNTSSFAMMVESFENKEVEANETARPLHLLPTPKNPHPPLAPRGSNYKEERAIAGIEANRSHPVVVGNFRGFDFNGGFPPDPIDACGPQHVMAQVNSSFRVWDKSGNLLKTIGLDQWYHAATPSNTGFSDPQIVYDHYANRWVMCGLMINPNNTDYIALAVSHDSSALGTWYVWGLPGWKLGDSTTTNFSDHPHMGFDDQAIYITTREFPSTGGLYARVRIIGKTQLYNNTAGSVSYTDLWDLRDPEFLDTEPDFVKPTISYGSPGGGYLMNAAPFATGTYMTVWKIFNPLTSPTMTADDISVVEYTGAPPPSQPGGGQPFEDIAPGGIAHKPIYRDSTLFMVHSVASGTGQAYSSVEYIKINPYTKTTLEDMSMGKDGFWSFYPSVTVDSAHNLYITYTRSGLTEYAGAFLSGRRAIDPPGLSPSVPLMRGVGHYSVLQGTRNRWGDYMGIALDPRDPGTAWAHTEYAEGTDAWGTWVGKVKLSPLPGRIIFADPLSAAFGTFEVGHGADTNSFVISNSGLDTLVISSIAVTDTNYSILHPYSLPLKVPTNALDTITVVFNPKIAGTFNDSLVILSNDTTNPHLALPLTGSAFIVHLAQAGIVYAASGSDGGGDLYLVNPYTGAATTLGPTGYAGVANIRVKPSTHELVGLIPSGTKQTYVRINSQGGDAHAIYNITVSVAKGMTFHGDTVYMGSLTGGIYRVDPPTGTPTLMASTGLRIGGLDFSPVSGALWASVTALSPVDGIYKVNLSTGVPTLVGRTGLNQAVQDIIFDPNGNLFGISGTASGSNSLILIDTLTGSGTVVGPNGTTAILALAMDPGTRFVTRPFHLAANWNLVSAPLVMQNNLTTSVFPFSTSKVYSYNGQYVISDTIQNGVGYWAKLGGARIYTAIGAVDTLDTIAVRRKWNVIGSLSNAVPVGSVTSVPSGIITTNFYRFDKDSGYVVASSIQPSMGYWVKVDSNGSLILSSSQAIPKRASQPKFVDVLGSMNALTIRDGIGGVQRLLFGNSQESGQSLEKFELPPPAPVGMMDARFGSNSLLAAYDGRAGKATDYPLAIQTTSYPVSLEWRIDHDVELKYSIAYSRGSSAQTVVLPIRGDGRLVLSKNEVSNLRLHIEGNTVPVRYALEQNYPNPFNPSTRIHYELPNDAVVKLVVYDILGREVVTLVNGRVAAGSYDATFLAGSVASGVYFYRLTAEPVDRQAGSSGFQSVKKMLLLK